MQFTPALTGPFLGDRCEKNFVCSCPHSILELVDEYGVTAGNLRIVGTVWDLYTYLFVYISDICLLFFFLLELTI